MWKTLKQCLLIVAGLIVTLAFVGMLVRPKAPAQDPTPVMKTTTNDYVVPPVTPQLTSAPTTLELIQEPQDNNSVGGNHVRVCFGHQIKVCS